MAGCTGDSQATRESKRNAMASLDTDLSFLMLNIQEPQKQSHFIVLGGKENIKTKKGNY